MCLTAKRNCFRYAKEDIECYKVVKKVKCGSVYKKIHGVDFVYETPYLNVIISEDIISGKEPMLAHGKCETTRSDGECCIRSGYIHTFSDYPNAWCFNRQHREEYHVFKCIIPKGTRYAKGYFGGVGAYASKKIIFIEEMKK